MTIKKCSCGKIVTTKNASVLGKQKFGDEMVLYFNCVCGSTHVILSKKTKQKAA